MRLVHQSGTGEIASKQGIKTFFIRLRALKMRSTMGEIRVKVSYCLRLSTLSFPVGIVVFRVLVIVQSALLEVIAAKTDPLSDVQHFTTALYKDTLLTEARARQRFSSFSTLPTDSLTLDSGKKK